MVASTIDADSGHGRLVLRLEGEVLDIGLAGLAIESDSRLIEQRSATLRIPTSGGELVVHGEVVWCFFHGTVTAESGAQVPVYRAGIEFSDVLTPLAEKLMQFLDGHALAAGESRLFERFRLAESSAVAVELEAPFRVVGAGPDGAEIEADLAAEALPGTRAVLHPKGVDDPLVAHLADIARSADDPAFWRLRLALEAPDSTGAKRLVELADPPISDA
jgi:hypothetical protein